MPKRKSPSRAPTQPADFNREQWLRDALALLQKHVFTPAGHKIPPVQISCGFPARSRKGRVIGEHWSPRHHTHVSSILVAPNIRDPIVLLGCVIHECVHAIVPRDGHGRAFREIAIACGLEGPMRATHVGDGLKATLQEHVLARLPEWSSRVLDPAKLPKQSTRLLKCYCGDCGYICRVTAKWIDSLGTPVCPGCGYEMEWTV